MKRLFVTDKEFNREFPRSRAKGHKRFVVSDDVKIMSPIEMVTDGTDLVAKPIEDNDEPEVYTLLCKEFGLVGYATDFKNKISVIFLDDGWMLVTLLHGALVMNLDGELLMPTVGDDFKNPAVVKDDIYWCDAENLLGYSKYLGIKGQFMYDFEFTFIIGGDRVNGMSSFYLAPLVDEDIDLSLGYVAEYEQLQQKKAEAREAQKMAKMFLNGQASYEYDEDEEIDEDEEDFDEYDEDDDVDYGF